MLPEITMSALAVLYHVQGKSRTNRQGDFVTKDALAAFVSSLEEDDIGYLYEPGSKEDDICTNPGELVGKIANSKMPFAFNWGEGVRHLVDVLTSLDEDYSKLGLVVTDCFTKEDVYGMKKGLERAKDVTMYVFAIGTSPALKEACQREGVHFQELEDVDQLDDRLKEIRKSLTVAK